MTEPELVAQILALVEGSIEDTRIPDAIAAHADKRAGKPVTKTDAAQLEAQLGVPVRISRQYKMTHIEWGMTWDEWRSGRQNSILIAHKDTNVNWPTGEELRTQEPAYFGARDTRNEQRRALLKEHKDRKCVCRAASDTCSGCWPPAGQPAMSAVTRAAKAILKFREAREELAQLLDYDKPMYVVKYPIEKIAEDK